MNAFPERAPERGAALEEWQEYACALRAGGMSCFEIAAHLLLDLSHLRRLLDPKALAASRRWNGAATNEFNPWPGTWQDGNSVNGRLPVRWLDNRIEHIHGSRERLSRTEQTLVRKLDRYRDDEAYGEIDAIDSLLVHFGLHASETPDYMWCIRRSRGASGASLLRPRSLDAIVQACANNDVSIRTAAEYVGVQGSHEYIGELLELARNLGRQRA